MISVVDPLSVPDAEFIFRMTDTDTEDILNSSWTLSKIENGDTVSVSSQNTLADNAQQIIPEWGLAVKFQNIPSLESGQLDNLGCLTCDGWFSVTNSQISEIIWSAMDDDTTSDNLSDLLSSNDIL